MSEAVILTLTTTVSPLLTSDNAFNVILEVFAANTLVVIITATKNNTEIIPFFIIKSPLNINISLFNYSYNMITFQYFLY